MVPRYASALGARRCTPRRARSRCSAGSLGALDLRAEPTDEHLQVVGRVSIVRAPDPIDKGIVRHQPPGIRDEMVEELVLDRREFLDWVGVCVNVTAPIAEVEDQIPQLSDRGALAQAA